MRLIDVERVVTLQMFDAEREEWYTEKLTIEEYLDRYTDEGCPTTIEVSEYADKERAFMQGYAKGSIEGYVNGRASVKVSEENELKFYYVDSIDDYWIGRRLDNFYYAEWIDGHGFVWTHSRYLPWSEYIVDEQTLWKEHTYPSEPREIPFTEWIVGFMKKHSVIPSRPQGKWIRISSDWIDGSCGARYFPIQCSMCGYSTYDDDATKFCPNCGTKMREV